MTHVVVIGAGQAGLALAARLRADGFEGQITLIGAEPHPPYQRPPLSKDYLLGELERERLYLRPESFYAENGIDLRLGAGVAAIDTGRQVVMMETGGEIAYDELVLCTGSSPRRLPAAIGGDLDGVLVMRDIRDADALAPSLVAGKRVLVVGGGYIGLEAAAVCAKRGLRVTLVEMAARILQRVAAPETSNYFRALHAAQGVTIREGVGLDRLIGEDGRVVAARLSTGEEIAVDLVLVGVGIAPNTRLAESAGIAVENGIRTDAYGRTSASNVWAAGDCASLPHGDGRIRLESVGNAIDQAEAVARNIMGAETPYVPQPWFWSDQYDTKLQIAGLNTGYDRVFVRQNGEALSHWYYCGERLVAVDAMNDSRAYMIGKRLIEAGKSPAPEVVIDPATDLKALLKA
ncbi:NAD(P)/FAD-dependent oxidoreductase [Rubellimicrobium aerolatum]|uniref:NAD(P)/FAD-dependent oxidoreductase n=1 Tax=Rubellimicrobium aerolatum TaxID=490979 RepID=A0ABW0SAR3_9RHOB|nr:FAD-dependent oxidoreductase [Rubellimicrobium aerolatum]MBP1806062.1 3-phenylpropionate/trans-cinnamate dioxygenase ferredoxin reductase subunit [Rubellimicrobium aerolatum]